MKVKESRLPLYMLYHCKFDHEVVILSRYWLTQITLRRIRKRPAGNCQKWSRSLRERSLSRSIYYSVWVTVQTDFYNVGHDQSWSLRRAVLRRASIVLKWSKLQKSAPWNFKNKWLDNFFYWQLHTKFTVLAMMLLQVTISFTLFSGKNFNNLF